MSTITLSLEQAHSLAVAALVQAGVTPDNARVTATALVNAEIDGQPGHGLSRIPSYVVHAKSGKVNGKAVPTVAQVADAVLRIDAGFGFAYPAIDLAVERLASLAATTGIAAAAICRSHHFGQAGRHVERLAEQGLIGLAFANAPGAMALPGGRRSLMGTNPIAFAAPLPGREPLVIDMALSVVARGKVMTAAKQGKPIPEGWALDADGNPTTDANAAMAGTMMPIGGPKGAALALMIEVICAALVGGNFAWNASSMFDGQGSAPDLGQLMIVLNPNRFGGDGYAQQMAHLLLTVAEDAPARLPGDRRLALRQKAVTDGVTIPTNLHAEISALAK